MNLKSIGVIASNCFREVIRDRILYFLVFYALIQVVALRLLPEVSATTADQIVIDFGLGAIGLLSVLVAIFVGTSLINKEIEKRTVLFLIPKPLSASELIVGKHLGLSGVLAVILVTMTAVYFGLLSWANIDYPLGTISVSILYLFLELMLLTAVAILFGVFTSSILATLFSFGVYLMGHLSTDLVKLGEVSENPQVAVMVEWLYRIVPDLSRLNMRNEAVYGALPTQMDLFTNGLYGVLYTVVLLMVAIFIFSRKQF